MLVEINPNKKVKDGDILIYEKGKFSPFNLSEKLKEANDKIEKYENEIIIFRKQFDIFNAKIEDYEKRLGVLIEKSERLEKALENTIRGFVTKWWEKYLILFRL